MKLSSIGHSPQRVDAVAKVTGKAKYTDDFLEGTMLVAKLLRSPFAHAVVKKIDASKARSLPGVEAVVTFQDVPSIKFATAGHPYSLDPAHRDKEDRLIFTGKARFVGDAIAGVVAVDELTAKKALKLIEVEYEELTPLLTPEAAMEVGAPLIHDDMPNNILAEKGFSYGDLDTAFAQADFVFEGQYKTSAVQHCHIENHIAYAYQEPDGRIVIVTSTQIPHIVRRIVAQSLGLPWGRVRCIKPHIGGGFGAKQDVCLEPQVAFLSLAVHGRPVKLDLSREECMIDTRTRHPIQFKIKSGFTKEGKLLGMHLDLISNTGAYASHGHSIPMAGGSKFRILYPMKALSFDAKSVYTNLPAAGAFRGYGSPQVVFAVESHLDDAARKLGLDPIKLRQLNHVREGYQDPLGPNQVLSCGLEQAIDKGKQIINWDEKKSKYANQRGNLRRGVGMAIFSYGSGTYPVGLELGGARLVLNQDGSVQLQVGGVEIGQGSDTVFSQIAAETLGIPVDMVNFISTQDTDVTPFDTGAYASRQTFVSGKAVQLAALDLKNKILTAAVRITGLSADSLEICQAQLINKSSRATLMSLAELSLHIFYDPLHGKQLTSEISHNAQYNAYVFGATFVEVEVDIALGKVKILEIYNVHDSGTIINPQLAEGQVHGGMAMGIGYALSEQLLFDPKTGKPLNNNLLDYKLPTTMDIPEMTPSFVETFEPNGPFGAKSLGEPPIISPAPAIRNAILDATGVALNSLPMNPQYCFEQFKAAGLIQKEVRTHV